ncbi:hypothetical protein [Sulfurospirillum arcachonense]|uniref:hypothetical protein n=1 Tax=Sulfurospirillum arcachonense TaxID=57666 RepID=UPI00046A9B95|nr:hypothetical protein [Sulfurospirillum arcachonense]
MIANDNAVGTYKSILCFLIEIYEIPKKSKTFEKLQVDITEMLNKESIDYKEDELKIAIIVFAIIESIQSNNSLNNSMNLLGTTLVENNITTALELENFLISDEEDLAIFRQIIKSRNSQKLDSFELNATLTKKGKTITVEHNGAKIKITD